MVVIEQDDAKEAAWRVMDRKWVDTAFGSHGTLGLPAVRQWQLLNTTIVLENRLAVPAPAGV
jgi:hypothetical protein